MSKGGYLDNFLRVILELEIDDTWRWHSFDYVCDIAIEIERTTDE